MAALEVTDSRNVTMQILDLARPLLREQSCRTDGATAIVDALVALPATAILRVGNHRLRESTLATQLVLSSSLLIRELNCDCKTHSAPNRAGDALVRFGALLSTSDDPVAYRLQSLAFNFASACSTKVSCSNVNIDTPKDLAARVRLQIVAALIDRYEHQRRVNINALLRSTNRAIDDRLTGTIAEYPRPSFIDLLLTSLKVGTRAAFNRAAALPYIRSFYADYEAATRAYEDGQRA
jgi:hypothetical protein